MTFMIHAKRWGFLVFQLVLTGISAVVLLPLVVCAKLYSLVKGFPWPVPAASPKSILITGASYGLGAGFAEHYAGPGVHLALTARSEDKLQEVRAACEAKGATVTVGAIDVTDQDAMKAFIDEVDDAAPLDLVIANAGVSEASAGLAKDLEGSVRWLTDVNLVGVYNTVFPAWDRMVERGTGGQIALMSSLAGYGGMPRSTAYFTSKNAVKAFGYGLRGQGIRHGIAVNTVCPGFVESEMTKINRFPMPFLMNQDQAIQYMVDQLAANVGVIAFPWPMSTLVWWMQNMVSDDVRDIMFMPFLALLPRRSGTSSKSD